MTEHTVVDLLTKEAIPSIDDPTFGRSVEGDPEERVIVVEGSDVARAYLTRILQDHEVVNGGIDGDPIAVTWCPLCASAVVYNRRVDGEVLTFGVSGKLADNDLVLYDCETESEWKQSSGVCLSGRHAGKGLRVRPAATMTLSAFREHYPAGEILQPPAWGSGDYGTDRFADYANSDTVGPGGDARLRTSVDDWACDFRPKAPTLGLTLGGGSRGYPRPVVEDEGGVVADTLGGAGIVVFAVPAGLFAYERDGLSFERTAEGEFRADGTAWNPATGGGEDGRTLTRVPSRRSFAFTWRDDRGPHAFYGV